MIRNFSCRKYLCSYFIFDLLSSFPLELLRKVLENVVEMADPRWRLIGVLSLLKIFRFHTLIIYMSRAADVSILIFMLLQTTTHNSKKEV